MAPCQAVALAKDGALKGHGHSEKSLWITTSATLPRDDGNGDFLNRMTLLLVDPKIYLTKKDLLCLRMLASGKTMKEIGSQLKISPRTVEAHLNTIKNKTGLLCKSQLITFFEKYFTYGF